MKYKNPFFKKRKKTYLNEIFNLLNLKKKSKYQNILINDIKNLDQATKNDITFYHSSKYRFLADKTKSRIIITNSKLSNILPKSKIVLVVDNVLLSIAKVTELFYPNSLNDEFENLFSTDENNKKFINVKFGLNVILGQNVKIGKNSFIGHNSIIESNVVIGNNCTIGSNVIIRKTLIGNNVSILDGAVIGKKGFGFFPNKNKNIKYPHIGMVVIGNNVEIGCNNTIDRGSLSNTIIGDNTFLDNQVHIAHNVHIGKNCIITGQVGFAGSSIVGNNVMIGGQAGVSGHLKIGNNVKIGGGSGVVKNLPDNANVMGYPAKEIKKFIKENM